MPPTGTLRLTIDQQSIAGAVAALRAEADGKLLRRDLLRELKATTTPLVAQLKGEISSMPSQGTRTQGPGLRASIASSLKPEVRLSGRDTGVAVKARKTPNLRGFAVAARATNRPSWRHRVYGRNVWVSQVGKPRWFDQTTQAAAPAIRAAVIESVENMAQRIAARASSG